ncbi:MAG TPA: hypothetical protein VM223_03825 [Planctomycetota bacterium]|nr:hypothetical protein [Planctomycetota bacterium]
MADVNVAICVRSSDGKLIAIDPNCSDVELPACMNASGELYVYHADCEGEGPEPLNDGWFKVCRAPAGGLQITIPDDCCAIAPCCSEQAFIMTLILDLGGECSRTVPYDMVQDDYCYWFSNQAGSGCCGSHSLWVKTDYSHWEVFGFALDRYSNCSQVYAESYQTFDCDGLNSVHTAFGYFPAATITVEPVA